MIVGEGEGEGTLTETALSYIISSIVLRARYDLNLSLNITRKNQVVRGIAFPKELYNMFRELSRQTGLSINKLVNIASLHFFLCLKQYNIDLRKLLFEKKEKQSNEPSIVDEIVKEVNGVNGEKEVEEFIGEVEDGIELLKELDKIRRFKEDGVWKSVEAFRKCRELSRKVNRIYRQVKTKLRSASFIRKLRKIEKTNKNIIVRLHTRLREFLTLYDTIFT